MGQVVAKQCQESVLVEGAPMKRTRAQKKAELMAHAEATVEKLLDWEEETDKPNLLQIEEMVLELRERIGKKLAEMVMEEQDAVQPAEPPRCPECGEPMRYKGRKSLDVESRVGPLDLERGYYHCARCESGLFPPGPATGVVGEEVE
jgi:hypothetical protein